MDCMVTYASSVPWLPKPAAGISLANFPNQLEGPVILPERQRCYYWRGPLMESLKLTMPLTALENIGSPLREWMFNNCYD